MDLHVFSNIIHLCFLEGIAQERKLTAFSEQWKQLWNVPVQMLGADSFGSKQRNAVALV